MRLRTTCPRCHGRPWSQRSWLTLTLDATCCTHRSRTVGGVCGFDLAEAPHDPISQRTADALDAFRAPPPDEPVTIGDITTTGAQHRDLLRNLYDLHAAAKRPDPLTTMTTALDAYDALAAGDVDAPALHAATTTHHFQRFFLAQRAKHPIDVHPVLLTWYANQHRQHLSKRTQLAWRAGRTHLAPPPAHEPATSARITRLPEHAARRLCPPAEWVPAALSAHLTQAPWAGDALGEALNALCFLGLGRSDTWAELALELHLPARIQHAARTRLNSVASYAWLPYLHRLEAHLTRLEQAPPTIDHRRRRHHVIDPAIVGEGFRRTSTPDTGDATTRFWAWYTGGHADYAPHGYPTASTPSPLDAKTLRAFRRVAEALPPATSQHPP